MVPVFNRKRPLVLGTVSTDSAGTRRNICICFTYVCKTHAMASRVSRKRLLSSRKMPTRTVGKSGQGRETTTARRSWRSRRLQTDQPPVRRSSQCNQNGPVRGFFSAVTVSNFVARIVFLPSRGQLPCFKACARVHHVSEKKSKAAEKIRSRRHETESTDWLVRAAVMSLVLLDELMRMPRIYLPGAFWEL